MRRSFPAMFIHVRSGRKQSPTKTESDAIRMWIRFFHVWPDATMAKACAGPLRVVSIINVYITLTR